MTDAPVLRSREIALPEPSSSAAGAALDVSMRRANEIAKCGDMIPATYRNKPGAVLLAEEWARTRQLDLLTTMQTVSFVGGKPVVDATMQRALAERAGYDVRVEEAGAESATVAVFLGGELRGRETYTLADANTAGLASKDNWRKNPRNMLVARATTNALRWHAPKVLLGVFDADEVDGPEPDPLDALVPTAPDRTPNQTEPVAEVVAEPEIVDAEVVADAPETDAAPEPELRPDGTPAPSGPPLDINEVKAHMRERGVTQVQALRQLSEMAAELEVDAPSTVAGLCVHPSDILRNAFVHWLNEQGS